MVEVDADVGAGGEQHCGRCAAWVQLGEVLVDVVVLERVVREVDEVLRVELEEVEARCVAAAVVAEVVVRDYERYVVDMRVVVVGPGKYI